MKMRFPRAAVPAVLAAFALASLGACGSSSGGNGSSSGGSSGFACNQPFGPDAGTIAFCLRYPSLPASQDNQARQLCTGGGGTILASCPTANRVGCCTATINGAQVASCYYAPADPSSEQQTCTMNGGTWSSM
jgi:hypothetical protein